MNSHHSPTCVLLCQGRGDDTRPSNTCVGSVRADRQPRSKWNCETGGRSGRLQRVVQARYGCVGALGRNATSQGPGHRGRQALATLHHTAGRGAGSGVTRCESEVTFPRYAGRISVRSSQGPHVELSAADDDGPHDVLRHAQRSIIDFRPFWRASTIIECVAVPDCLANTAQSLPCRVLARKCAISESYKLSFSTTSCRSVGRAQRTKWKYGVEKCLSEDRNRVRSHL